MKRSAHASTPTGTTRRPHTRVHWPACVSPYLPFRFSRTVLKPYQRLPVLYYPVSYLTSHRCSSTHSEASLEHTPPVPRKIQGSRLKTHAVCDSRQPSIQNNTGQKHSCAYSPSCTKSSFVPSTQALCIISLSLKHDRPTSSLADVDTISMDQRF